MNKLGAICVSALAATMVGCAQNVPPLEINSETGTITLDQIVPETTCINFFVDMKLNVSVEGDTVSYKQDVYESTDGSCSGASQNLVSYKEKYSNDGDVSVGWDGIVPDRADATGPLSDPANASKFTREVFDIVAADGTTAPTAETVKDIIYVDDTGATPVVYVGDSLSTTDADGYPTLLSTTAE